MAQWSNNPRPFQLASTIAQIEGIDMIIQAPTGSGKTAVVAGPHAWAPCKNMVTFMAVPLIALGEEMAQTFKDDFGLTAVFIHSKNGALSSKVIQVQTPPSFYVHSR